MSFELLAVIALAVLALWAVYRLLIAALIVAEMLFRYAARSGFPGVAIYALLWILAFPVMLTICIVGGVILIAMSFVVGQMEDKDAMRDR